MRKVQTIIYTASINLGTQAIHNIYVYYE